MLETHPRCQRRDVAFSRIRPEGVYDSAPDPVTTKYACKQMKRKNKAYKEALFVSMYAAN